jgi:hypothetical protein
VFCAFGLLLVIYNLKSVLNSLSDTSNYSKK